VVPLFELAIVLPAEVSEERFKIKIIKSIRGLSFASYEVGIAKGMSAY